MPAQRRKPAAAKSPPPAEPSSFWRHKMNCPGFLSILLAIAVVGVYVQVVTFDFVNYDDPDYVTANPQVQGGLSSSSVRWAFEGFHASNWHPLTWLSHMVDYQLFGRKPGAHHLVSVAFHLANTLLLFLVFRRMTGAAARSAM